MILSRRCRVAVLRRGTTATTAGRSPPIFQRMNHGVQFRLGGAVAIALMLGGCVGQAVKPDAMCPEIARFANASTDYEAHSVVLRTSWGSGFDNNPEHLYEIECTHSDYGPGRMLCAYLMEDASIEFASNNFRRALSCLSAHGRDIGAGVDIIRLDGEFSSSSARGVDDDVKVSIEFDDEDRDEPPSLRITARRLTVD